MKKIIENIFPRGVSSSKFIVFSYGQEKKYERHAHFFLFLLFADSLTFCSRSETFAKDSRLINLDKKMGKCKKRCKIATKIICFCLNREKRLKSSSLSDTGWL